MAHTFANLLVHIVFGTKHCEPLIGREIRPRLHAYLGGITRELKGIALEVGGTADHVHMLVKLPPTLAPSDALRVLKSNSSKWAHELIRGFQWQLGFGAFSVSQSAVEKVRHYIATQEEHHRMKTFAEEYLEFLKANGVEYDERFVFE